MTNEELVELIQKGINVKENTAKLYDQVKNLIKYVANKYHSDDFEDLVQEAYFGFDAAVKNYDHNAGASFANYLEYWIKQSIYSYIYDHDTIKLPKYLKEKQYKYKRLLQEYEKEYGRKPSNGFICAKLNITLDQLDTIISADAMCSMGSLDTPIDSNEGTEATIGDLVPDPRNDYEDLIEDIVRSDLADKLWNEVDTLKASEAKILRDHYINDKALTDVAKDNNITYSEAQKLEHHGLYELRRRKSVRQLKEEAALIYGWSIKNCSASHFNRTWTSSTEYAALRLL